MLSLCERFVAYLADVRLVAVDGSFRGGHYGSAGHFVLDDRRRLAESVARFSFDRRSR